MAHQANLRIAEMMQKDLGLRDDQVYNNIMWYGNTTAATIPIALDECVRSRDGFGRGDLVGDDGVRERVPVGERGGSVVRSAAGQAEAAAEQASPQGSRRHRGKQGACGTHAPRYDGDGTAQRQLRRSCNAPSEPNRRSESVRP